MLGHLMEWFYTGLGGIKQEENSFSFRNIIIRPEIVGDITQVTSSYQSPYGMIRSAWKKEKNILGMKIDIPVNTSATIYLPTLNRSSITVDGRPIDNKKDIHYLKSDNGKSLYRIGSGSYHFILKIE